MKTIYDTNQTMKILGQQTCYHVLNAERFEHLRDVLQANVLGERALLETGMDVFMLGYMCGKHDERQRKK